MQKRFKPDEGGVFPEWEEKTIEEVCDINVSNGMPNKEFMYIELGDVDKYGILKRKNLVQKHNAPVSAKRVAKLGDVFFRSVRPENKGHFHYVKEMSEQVVMSSAFFQLRMKNGDNGFLYQVLNTDYFNKQVLSRCAGTAYPTISLKEFVKLKIRVPKSIEEQQKIAKALALFDEMIAVKREELEVFKELKKTMMKALFDRTKRFKDENGNEYPEWEEKTLGEIAEITTGKLNANEMVKNGKFNFYTSGTEVFKIDKAAFTGPAITIAGNGANVGCLHLADGKFNAYQRTYVLQNLQAYREYIYAAIEMKLPSTIKKYKRGSAIPYIVIDTLKSLKLPIPCLEEQQKIGNFLSDIDTGIEIQKDFINLYAEAKKVMMKELIC